MTVSAAAFADATFSDRSAAPVRRIGALLVRHLLLGTAAVATTGFAIVGLTAGVGLLASSSVVHRHDSRAAADFRLRSIALVPSYPTGAAPSRPADIVVFPPTAADLAKPVHVAEHAPPRRAAPPANKHADSVPVPRPLPPDLASLRTMQRLASLPPAPAPRVAPPRHVEKPAARTPDDHTAVYDISARSVYLPNGKTLEAHSGLGDLRDDPRSIRTKMRGATPPNTYDLSLRERSFHGVRAIRMTPVDDDKMYGRAGILAHTYMLGPDGDSNGCVSFKDYSEFLQAYLKGDIDRLVVVAGNGAAYANRSSNRDARYASSEPGPSSPQFSAAR
jgi:type VI secretion system (T6SS) effector TldE1-like protein